MQRSREEKRIENIRTPYSTEKLLQQLSPTAKKFYKMFRLLEPPQQKRRIFYKYLNILVSMYVGVASAPNLRYVPGKGVQTVPNVLSLIHGYCYIFVIPLTIHKLYHFYEDQGEYIYMLFMELSLEKRKQGLRELKKLDRIQKVGAALLLLTTVPTILGPLIMYGSVAPTWFLVFQWIGLASYFQFFFFGGFTCFIFFLYHISFVSSCAVHYIESISKKYYEAFVIKYNVEDAIHATKQKKTVDQLTQKFEDSQIKLSRAYKIFPLPFLSYCVNKGMSRLY